jgi:hypothetical protein
VGEPHALLRHQSAALDHGGADEVGRADPRERQPAGHEPLLEVGAVVAHVIRLPEPPQALLRRGRRVLVGRLARPPRHLQQRARPRGEHPCQLDDRGTVVDHVLEHVVADRQVDRTGGERERGE